MSSSAYLPIENYGIIGNMRSAALVGTNGSIDWFCFPHFDSPSIFASILDSGKGGCFSVRPADTYTTKQFYWPDTNVLISRFLTSDGIVEVADFMPAGSEVKEEKDYLIYRKVSGINGTIKMSMECKPAFNYGRDSHVLSISGSGAAFHSSDLSMGLASSIPLDAEGKAASVEFTLHPDDSVIFVLHQISKDNPARKIADPVDAEKALRDTIHFWRNWLAGSQYKGRWRERVNRSALILKLLTFEPSGAIVAAVTCSLPEDIGGERNWDYRYTWIRDAAFTVYAFLRLGFTQEAAAFMKWIRERSEEHTADEPLQIMYGIDGRHKLEEQELDHLEGYMKSSPVRIGNGAYDQLQLDIYGELIDSIYLFDKHVVPIGFGGWKVIVKLVDWVVDNWNRKDEGIWEVRGGQQDFVYSRLMCWVALDRAVRLSRKRSFPADLEKWIKVRDAIYLDIMRHGWSEQKQSFVQYYGSQTLDAANLMMPLVFFLSPNDPMMIKTLEATLRSPSKGGLVTNGLVYRYNASESPDGLKGEEGTFNICTFWLVEALTRAGKAEPALLEEARLMFEHMLNYSNHLGIYSEELGINGDAHGNTPQAFTHLALISAAYNLDKALG